MDPVLTSDSPAASKPRFHADARLLFFYSALLFFLELFLIRQTGARVRVMAFFPNLVLLAAFAGFSWGLRSSDGRHWPSLWLPLLGLFIAMTEGLHRVVIFDRQPTEFLWAFYADRPADAPRWSSLWPASTAVFIGAALVFVPLGQGVGREWAKFDKHPLKAYAAHAAGGLAGALFFFALARFGAPPGAMTALLTAGAWALPLTRRGKLVAALSGVAILGLQSLNSADAFSPYYDLQRRFHRADPRAFAVFANGSLHQVALPMNRDAPILDQDHQSVRDAYHGPFDRLGSPPRRALVLGSGLGNDVAVLRDRGVTTIDAVEIDPVIRRWGRDHPDRPFEDPSVRVWTGDARSFIARSTDSYDLIVLGTLDSMTRLSAFAAIRLDSFVYTREAFHTLRDRLSKDGGLILYTFAPNDLVRTRLRGLLTDAFGVAPLEARTSPALMNTVFLTGPLFQPNAPPASTDARHLPTDDRPHLYWRRFSFPFEYLWVSLAASIVALAGWAWGTRRDRTWEPSWLHAAAALWGAGFALLQVRSITAFHLIWGSTWQAGATALLATLASTALSAWTSDRRPMRIASGLAGLGVALLFSAVLSPSNLLPLSPIWRVAAAIFLIALPVYFSTGLIGRLWGRARSTKDLMACNALGAVIGGLLETAAVFLGFRELVSVAAVFYIAGALVGFRFPPRARNGH